MSSRTHDRLGAGSGPPCTQAGVDNPCCRIPALRVVPWPGARGSRQSGVAYGCCRQPLRRRTSLLDGRPARDRRTSGRSREPGPESASTGSGTRCEIARDPFATAGSSLASRASRCSPRLPRRCTRCHVSRRRPTKSPAVARADLLSGHLSLPADANPEFFAIDNVIDRGRWYSQFPIAGPAVFALANDGARGMAAESFARRADGGERVPLRNLCIRNGGARARAPSSVPRARFSC
jgi:hypothetical protein